MNKQEAIEKINELRQKFAISLSRRNSRNYYLKEDVLVANIQNVIDIINQIDEPEKPVIPQFVADWIEENKSSFSNLYNVYSWLSFKKNAVAFWANENLDEFARAWLNGYSVIKEPLYWVNVPNGDRIDLKLCKTPENEIVLDSFGCSKLIDHKLKLTKHEIENAGFGWVFDCGFAKEVKE